MAIEIKVTGETISGLSETLRDLAWSLERIEDSDREEQRKFIAAQAPVVPAPPEPTLDEAVKTLVDAVTPPEPDAGQYAADAALEALQTADVVDTPVPPAPDTTVVTGPPLSETGTITPDVELDTEGLPWDARIHNKLKTKKKTGEWKVTRGTDPALVTSVKAELTALMIAPVPSAPAAPDAGTVPPPPATVDDDAPKTFPEFTERFLELGVTNVQVNEILKTHGVASFPMLSARPDLIPAVWAELKKCSTQ